MYVKLAYGTKIPVKGQLQYSEDLWQGFNNALVLNNRTAVDFDRIDAARDFYRAYPQLCSVLVRTRRGIHAHFSGETRARKLLWKGEHVGEIKSGARHHIVIPPSVVKGHKYTYLRNNELQPFPEHLFPERKEVKSPQIDIGDKDQMIYRARCYLQKVRPAVHGQGGHSAALYAAACLVQKFQLTVTEAWPLLLEWNQRCSPPWDISNPKERRELFRKLEEAERLSHGFHE